VHIFIDETGSFSGFGTPKSLSLIGALVIPDTRLAKIEKAYLKRRVDLPKYNGEVKGRLLDEAQVLSLTRLLRENSAIFRVTAIDFAYHSEAGLTVFKNDQAEKITGGLTDEHEAALKKQTWEFRKRFESYSLPLVVQSILTFKFLPTVLEMSMMNAAASGTRSVSLGRGCEGKYGHPHRLGELVVEDDSAFHGDPWVYPAAAGAAARRLLVHEKI
jgi:hypothetical protein